MISAAPPGPGATPPAETTRVRLLCSSGRLPESLAPGDLRDRTTSPPAGLVVKDITRFTQPIAAPLAGDLSWRLVTHMALNFLPLASLDTLRALLKLYDVRSLQDAGAAHVVKLDRKSTRLNSSHGYISDAAFCLKKKT